MYYSEDIISETFEHRIMNLGGSVSVTTLCHQNYLTTDRPSLKLKLVKLGDVSVRWSHFDLVLTCLAKSSMQSPKPSHVNHFRLGFMGLRNTAVTYAITGMLTLRPMKERLDSPSTCSMSNK